MEALNTLLIVAFICGIPLAIIGFIIYATVANLNLQKAHQRLAEALGFKALNQAGNIQKTWYGGIHNGRRVAFKVIAVPYRTSGGDGGSRIGVQMQLRVVMEASPKNAEGLHVYSNKVKNIPNSFEEAFTVKGAFLSQAARDAMLAFAYMGYSTGFNKDFSLRFTHGLRDLTLIERNTAEKNTLSEEILPDAKSILIHNHLVAEPTPAQFKALLSEMDAVAQAIEQGTPAPFAGNLTPPQEGNGKVTFWVIIGFVFVVIPTCLCICAVAYTIVFS